MRVGPAIASLMLVITLVAAGCGSDNDGDNAENGTESGQTPTTQPASNGDGESGSSGSEAAPVEPTEPAGGEATGGGGDGVSGSVVLGPEVITFDSSRCFLEEQDAAAGGGKILFVVQAFGTNAAGEEVSLDVSRFDEDSQFTGDVVSLVIGDPFSGEAVSVDATGDIGTVTVDGQFVNASELTFVNLDDGTEQLGSFEVNC